MFSIVDIPSHSFSLALPFLLWIYILHEQRAEMDENSVSLVKKFEKRKKKLLIQLEEDNMKEEEAIAKLKDLQKANVALNDDLLELQVQTLEPSISCLVFQRYWLSSFFWKFGWLLYRFYIMISAHAKTFSVFIYLRGNIGGYCNDQNWLIRNHRSSGSLMRMTWS